VHDRYFQIVARLDAAPLQLPSGTLVTGNLVRLLMFSSLYSDDDFSFIATILRDADRRSAKDLQQLSAMIDPVIAPAPTDNDVVSTLGVFCDDVTWPSSAAQYQADVLDDMRAYPVAGGLAANIWPCAFWPFRPQEPPVTIGATGPRNILLVEDLRDPATPYDGAVAMQQQLGSRAGLLTVDRGGHAVSYGILGDRYECVDDTVTTFLVAGTLADSFCPAEQSGSLLAAPSAPQESHVKRAIRKALAAL
jgi:hypothetical protein